MRGVKSLIHQRDHYFLSCLKYNPHGDATQSVNVTRCQVSKWPGAQAGALLPKLDDENFVAGPASLS